jgi:hypothetical protein
MAMVNLKGILWGKKSEGRKVVQGSKKNVPLALLRKADFFSNNK